MATQEKVYFVSDSHLGIPDAVSSREREMLLVRWLEMVRRDATAIVFLGDIFDFWFEYKKVVPRGYVRLLGKIAEIADQGIAVHYFPGNHDMWVFDYFEKELGVQVHRAPRDMKWAGKVFHVAHGDGLGPGDRGYKLLKSVFRCRLCQRMFAFLHPAVGIGMALFLSKRSRIANREKDKFLGEDKEWLVQYSKDRMGTKRADYFVYGHRHMPVKIELEPGVFYINTGDWIHHYSYAVFDGKTVDIGNFS